MNALRVYDYLSISRRRLFDWIRPLAAVQYVSEHPIGLGSLARTLHHVKAAEQQYMERIRGKTGPLGPRAPEDDPEVTTEQAMPFGALEAAWAAQAERTRADLAAVGDWDAVRVYTTEWEGKPFSYEASASDVFAQLALHEVHHRAQALHMLRRLGVVTAEIDYNALMWTRVHPK